MTSDAEIDGSVLSDPELIVSARLGDSQSFGTLYERHAGAAWAVARQYTNSAADAEDVVSEAFTRLYTVLQEGGGPDTAFRAYLFTVIRRLGMARVEGVRRDTPTDDEQMFEQAAGSAAGPDEPMLEGFERGVVGEAYRSLPERWQAVLWYTEVERLPSAQIAPLLGLSANGVAALAYRAREGLRQAYLQQHLAQPLDDGCREVAGKLGAYVRGGLAKRETAQVDEHLETCARCRALLLELGDVNHGMRGIIAPLVLGLLGTGALAHQLPVGGGIAAGWAVLGEHGLAGATAGSGAGSGVAGSGGTSTGASGGAAAGGAGASGAGAAGAAAGAAAAGGGIFAGITGLLGALPVAAAVVGAGLLVAATLGVAGLLGVFTNDDADVITRPGGTVAIEQELGVDPPAAEVPADPPVVAPPDSRGWYGGRDDATEDIVVPEVPAEAAPTVAPGAGTDDEAADPGTDAPGTGTGGGTGAPGTSVLQPGDVTATPVDTSVDIAPDGTATLELLVVNTGPVDALGLTAEVSVPTGVVVQVDGTSSALDGVAGAFAAPGGDTAWSCVPDADATGASCTLPRLVHGNGGASTLTVALSVPADFESADAATATVSLKIPDLVDAVSAAFTLETPGRVALDAAPASWSLGTGTTTDVALGVRNAGTRPVAAGAATVDLTLPAAVEQAEPTGATWRCDPRTEQRALHCVNAIDLPGRTPAPLTLTLTTAAGVADGSSLAVQARVATAGGRGPQSVEVPITVLGSRLELAEPPYADPLPDDGSYTLVFTVVNSGGGFSAPGTLGVSLVDTRGVGATRQVPSLAPHEQLRVTFALQASGVSSVDVDVSLTSPGQAMPYTGIYSITLAVDGLRDAMPTPPDPALDRVAADIDAQVGERMAVGLIIG
ncbi:sigma-70 family RNA polymerase sigma factor [Cellulomonas hominis]